MNESEKRIDPLRIKVGNLNRLSSSKLKAVMDYYGYSSPAHTVNVLVDALFTALQLEIKGD